MGAIIARETVTCDYISAPTITIRMINLIDGNFRKKGICALRG